MFTDQRLYLRYLQIMSDLICFALLYLLIVPLFLILSSNGFAALFNGSNAVADYCMYKTPLYIGCGLVIVTVIPWVLVALNFYERIPTSKQANRLTDTTGLCILQSLILCGILTLFDIPTQVFFKTLAFSIGALFILLLVNRVHLAMLVRKNTSHPYLIKNIILVGTGPESLQLADYIKKHPESGIRLTGFLTAKEQENQGQISDHRILGTLNALPELILDHTVDSIFVAGDKDMTSQSNYLFQTCSTMGLEFATTKPELISHPFGRISVEELNGMEITLFNVSQSSPLGIFFKRCFDFCGSTALILCCLPFWIVIPILIKSSSPGNFFFKQERIGRHGKKFTLYKFRSMTENAIGLQKELMHLNEMDGPAFKIKKDPRLTPTGKVLRAYSLDELPQLFNVFLGDISLVGPRPAIADEVRQYRPKEYRRLSVTQGISCIWQVSGRNDIKFDEWMKLDLLYIDNRSAVLDLKILFRTIPAVLMKKGAY